LIAETVCTFTIAHRAGRYARGAKRVTQGVLCERTLTNRSAWAAAGFVVNEAMRFFALEQKLERIATILLPNSVALPGMDQNGGGRLSQIL
jgi:hypothetical protein